MKPILTLLAFLLLAPLAALHAAEPVAIDLATRTWQGIPGLERTAKGRVFVSWFTGGTKEPAPENTVLLSHSDDGGQTFTAPQAVALPLGDGTRCFDPGVWIDPTGRLWYFFCRGNKETAQHDVWARICGQPDAETPVFGAEFRVGFEGPYAFRMNKPTVLSTGEWIIPVTHATETIKAWFAGSKQLQGVGISTDEGKTWKLHGALKAPEWALECMITELKDGRLWLLTRTGGGFLWESHSKDKGRTWSEAKASTIASPGARFFIRRLASGNLLLVNHYKFTGRSHLTAQLSTDEGATWNEGLLLDERGGVSYPDGVQDKDGLIWITYDRDRGGAGEILLAKFKEEDVIAGNNVSGAVSLKQVVNKLDKPFADCYRELDSVRGANVFVSDDDGGHWRYRGGIIFQDSCFNEHSVVELNDGRLWMLSRGMKETLQSYSADGGKTWQPQSTAFPHVNSKCVIRCLQSRNILLIRHGQDLTKATPARQELTAFLSTDEGRTWSGKLLLDERTGVSYPDIARAPHGDIYVHYDRDRYGAAEILFARFCEEDVTAGRLVSKDASLKNIVKSRQLGMNRGGTDATTSPEESK